MAAGSFTFNTPVRVSRSSRTLYMGGPRGNARGELRAGGGGYICIHNSKYRFFDLGTEYRDAEANPQLSARFQVRGIPNYVVLSGGRTVFQQAGLVDNNQMEQWLRSPST
jgi:hypothetical protein